MERVLLSEIGKKVGEEVAISGYIDVRRDHGKLIFLVIRDRSASVQGVVLPNHAEALAVASKLRSEFVVKITGMVNERPEKMKKADEVNGGVEIEIKAIEILAEAIEVPFEKDADLNLDTHLDHLPFTLRRDRVSKTFKVQAEIVTAYREALRNQDFTEFQAPKIIGEDAEGGANSFSIEYFKKIAHLAQSPQLYKQIMVGVHERVFSVGNVYRAEKHSTTRHLNEYTSLDAEMGYIKDHTDVMSTLSTTIKYIFESIEKKFGKNLYTEFGVEVPLVPEVFPSITLREAQKLIFDATNVDKTKAPDLDPEDERWLCEYAKKEFKSDFIFVTHFPTSKRPFYTYRDEANPEFTKGFDLLFNGVEIATGAQRIHNYNDLVASMKEKNLDPEKFSFYLQAFKYGMPPHGGWGMGLERLTQKILGLSNVKEATLFPRDLNRIDVLLSGDK